MQSENRSSFILALHLLFPIRVHENGQRCPVGTNRRLDHEWQESRVRRLVEVFQFFLGKLLMLREIEVSAIVNAFNFLKSKRTSEIELNIERTPGVMRELLLRVLMEHQAVFDKTERAMPFHS